MYRQRDNAPNTPVIRESKEKGPALPKLPYIPAQRMSDKMSDDQKRGVQMWNMMRQRLIDTDQMDDKRGS